MATTTWNVVHERSSADRPPGRFSPVVVGFSPPFDRRSKFLGLVAA